MPYQIVDGHDNTGTLADVTIQPKSPGVLATRRTTGGDGTVYEDGLYVVWEYTNLSDSQWDTLITEFGLDGVYTNDVTIRTKKNDDRSFVNYNGTIVKPEQDQDVRRTNYMYRDAQFIIINLSTPS
jgi:hypothetical protein